MERLTAKEKKIVKFLQDNSNNISVYLKKGAYNKTYLVRGMWISIQEKSAKKIIKHLNLKSIPGYKTSEGGIGWTAYVLPENVKSYI